MALFCLERLNSCIPVTLQECFPLLLPMSACCSHELSLSSCIKLSIHFSCVDARAAFSAAVLLVLVVHTESITLASCQCPHSSKVPLGRLPCACMQTKLESPSRVLLGSQNHCDSSVLFSVYCNLALFIACRDLHAEEQCRAKNWSHEDHEKFSFVRRMYLSPLRVHESWFTVVSSTPQSFSITVYKTHSSSAGYCKLIHRDPCTTIHS